MDYVGIDAVEFGAADMQEASRFFTGWGLKRIASTRAGMVFETGIGSQVVVRPELIHRSCAPV